MYLKLNKNPEQDASQVVEDMREIKLDYKGTTDDLLLTNVQAKVIEGYLHNNGERLTYVRRGMSSFTFQLPKKDAMIQKADLLYYIESNDVRGLTHRNGDSIEVYIRSGIVLERFKNAEEEPKSFANATQMLYNVSEEI